LETAGVCDEQVRATDPDVDRKSRVRYAVTGQFADDGTFIVNAHTGEVIIVVVGSLGPINCTAVSFLSGLGQRIAEVSCVTRDGSFLFQWLSVLIQRFDAFLVRDCFVGEVTPANSTVQ